ncbi:MAG TPA: hypothetical protein VF420_13205 [Casimicrobiaceae bacterium]
MSGLIPVSASGVAVAFRGRATADLGNVGADACALESINLSVSPSQGDMVIASPHAGDLGVALAMFPGFAPGGGNTVNVNLVNVTAGGLNPASQDYDWSVISDSFNEPSSGIICYDRRSVTFDAGACADITTTVLDVLIGDTEPGDTVCLCAPAGFPAGLGIGVGSCVVAGTAKIPFVNPTGAPIDPGSLTYPVVILKRGQRASPSGRAACIKGSLPGLNPGAAAANDVTGLSLAVPKARAGDVGFVATQLATGVVYAMGRCAVDGTLIVPAINPSAAPVDPGAATYAFALFR